MINKGLFSQNSIEWKTPIALFLLLNEKYSFTFDAACTSENCLCTEGFHIDLGQDALVENWPRNGWIFCNPPYGKLLKQFVIKAYNEWRLGSKIVMLLPARTDTNYFHDYIKPSAKITFLRGRIKFNDKKGRAPFPSMVIVYDVQTTETS